MAMHGMPNATAAVHNKIELARFTSEVVRCCVILIGRSINVKLEESSLLEDIG